MPYIAPKLDKDGKKIRPDGAKPTYTDEEIMEVVVAQRGNITESAKYLGFKPSYLRIKIMTNPVLKAEYSEIRLGWLEKAQDFLYRELDKDKPALWAINRALDSEAAKRFKLGEVKSFKVDSENLNVNTTITDEDLEKLSLEEKVKLEQFIAKLTDKDSDN